VNDDDGGGFGFHLGVGDEGGEKVRVGREEKRYGLLDSGATHNSREIKKDENYQGLVPAEVKVALDSEVKAELFMKELKPLSV
jgi:hypothetical protein